METILVADGHGAIGTRPHRMAVGYPHFVDRASAGALWRQPQKRRTTS
jgi:hypothetical protein